MLRPQSIVLFERCYLGAWAIGLVNTAMSWSRVQSDPNVARANEMVGAWYAPTIAAVGLLIPLVLWYFIARRGSVVAKWIMVALTAFGVLTLAYSMMAGRMPVGIAMALSLVGVALNVVAASCLFRADALPWFGGARTEAA